MDTQSQTPCDRSLVEIGPVPRASFSDLPEEVLELVAYLAEKRYPLMLTCKAACIPAGRAIYHKLFSAQPRITETINLHAINIFEGIFGDPDSSLKLKFFQTLRTVYIHTGMYQDYSDSLRLHELLAKIVRSKIVCFPNCSRLVIQRYDTWHMEQPGYQVFADHMLAIVRPDHFCLQGASYSELQDWKYESLPVEFRHQPLTVTHHVSIGVRGTISLIDGIVNRIHFTGHVEGAYEMKEVTKYIVELLLPYNNNGQSAQQEDASSLKDRTTWQFLCVGSLISNDTAGQTRGVEAVATEVYEKLPRLKDRIEFPVGEVGPCDACGCDMYDKDK